MSLTVPSILKYLANNSVDNEQPGAPPRAKKRRLDHLTWEEKLQRKKLKNRVAAQTSRDRKKQRMEEMESALQELFLKNEALLEECTELREENSKLLEENSELQDKIEKSSCTCRQNSSAEYEVQHRSTEGAEPTLSRDFEDTNANGTLENCYGLPSLPDLLNELDRDVDLESLEQLTQSLLQDIAADLEAAAQATNCEESTPAQGSINAGGMVGSTSESMDSSGCERINSENVKVPDNSSFQPLLHHEYSAKQKPVTSKRISTGRNRQSKKLQPIRPKESKKSNVETLYLTQPSVVENSEVLYGTLDESTNCITIVINDNLPISEAITEVETSDLEKMEVICDDGVRIQSLSVPQTAGSISPAYSSSDCGYESLDSPHSIADEASMDMWDHSVSELFPTLF